jgi:hypothetical protein
MLYIYIYIYKALCKAKNLTSYIYGPTFGNAESRLFLFSAQCFNTESMQQFILWHSVSKHFASHHDYPNYRWDLVWFAEG